jgi:hypothetical protein
MANPLRKRLWANAFAELRDGVNRRAAERIVDNTEYHNQANQATPEMPWEFGVRRLDAAFVFSFFPSDDIAGLRGIVYGETCPSPSSPFGSLRLRIVG